MAGLWGLWQVALAVLAAELPVVVKGGILAGAVGSLVLLISVLRERLYTRKRTRYDDIVR